MLIFIYLCPGRTAGWHQDSIYYLKCVVAVQPNDFTTIFPNVLVSHPFLYHFIGSL
uniref:Uncharacterized protein n=1 Tax=Anguilla anguilla TaxID=7936 RepID=A0A0E9QYF6_ANGAN